MRLFQSGPISAVPITLKAASVPTRDFTRYMIFGSGPTVLMILFVLLENIKISSYAFSVFSSSVYCMSEAGFQLLPTEFVMVSLCALSAIVGDWAPGEAYVELMPCAKFSLLRFF